MTLRRLTRLYDYHLLETWNHTAVIACGLYNLQATLVNVNTEKGKRTIKPKTPFDFHPYRYKAPKPEGLKITKKNFTDLKMFGNMVCKK